MRIRAATRAIGDSVYTVLLDERGLEYDTLALARRLGLWMQAGRPLALIIGGADGVDTRLKKAADECLRLSSLTLQHNFACLLLCEQLYRSWSVLHGLPYHRD